MKTLGRILLIMLVFVGSCTLVSAQKEMATGFGDYTLKRADVPMVVNETPVETYVVSYDKMEEPIYIGVVTDKKCKNYIVRTNGFEIQYVCKRNKFGICYTESRFATMDQEELQKKINRSAFLHQRVISSSGPKPDVYHVSLIASYLPDVMQAG